MKTIALVKVKASCSYVKEITLLDALKEHTKCQNSSWFTLNDKRLLLETTLKLKFDTFAEMNLKLEQEIKAELNTTIWVDNWNIYWELEKVYGEFDD